MMGIAFMIRDGRVTPDKRARTLIGVFQSTMLTKRRVVDNCRVGSTLCQPR